MWWRDCTVPTATCRRAGKGPIHPKLRHKEILIWKAVFPGWILSSERPFGDILEKILSPIRRGPRSYQYRVNLERRGPAALNPAGFFCDKLWARRISSVNISGAGVTYLYALLAARR